jgi:hypothetical protein
MTYNQLKKLVQVSENKLCRRFDYHAFW